MYKGYVIFPGNKKLTPIQFRNQLLIVYLLCVFYYSIDKGPLYSNLVVPYYFGIHIGLCVIGSEITILSTPKTSLNIFSLNTSSTSP